jgi:hypothetical protein
MNWKLFGSKRPWPNFKVLSRHSSGKCEENHENPQDRRSLGRDLNPGSPECDAGVLTTRPQRSVLKVTTVRIQLCNFHGYEYCCQIAVFLLPSTWL